MEKKTCTTYDLNYKGSTKYIKELTNNRLAASRQNYCQQCKRILNLTDKQNKLRPR